MNQEEIDFYKTLKIKYIKIRKDKETPVISPTFHVDIQDYTSVEETT